MPEKDNIYDIENMEFGELLTAPLNACVDAQAQAATATAEYIQNIGFQYDEQEKVYKPVTFSFSYTTEEGRKRFTIPLISVVPVPYLQIRNVNLVFSTELTTEDGGELRGKISTDDKNKKEQEVSSSFKSSLKVNVNIKASSADMPMGISKLLQVMQHQITVKTIPPTEENTTKDIKVATATNR